MWNKIVEQLANNNDFIVGTGIVTILGFIIGFFTCKKIYKTDNSKKIKKNNQNIGNNSNNNSQVGIS